MPEKKNQLIRKLSLLLVQISLIIQIAEGQTIEEGAWHYFGGDNKFNRYSPLDQINANNVGQIRIVWRKDATAAWLQDDYDGLGSTKNLRSTPLLIDDVLYVSLIHI